MDFDEIQKGRGVVIVCQNHGYKNSKLRKGIRYLVCMETSCNATAKIKRNKVYMLTDHNKNCDSTTAIKNLKMKAECRRRAAENRGTNLREIYNELSAHEINGHCVSYNNIRSSMYKRRIQRIRTGVNLFNNENLQKNSTCSHVTVKESDCQKSELLTLNASSAEVIVNAPYQQCYTFKFDAESDMQELVQMPDNNLLMVHILCDRL